MKTKRLLSVLLVLATIFSVFAVPVVAEENIKVVLNGAELSFDVPPQLINSRTMVPMRKIFEALGATVDWAGDTQTITAKKDDTVIVMQIDNVIISVSGKEIELDVPPQLVESRTLVPVRAVAESLDAEVKWEGDTQTVIITTKEDKVIQPETTKTAWNPEKGSLYGYGNDWLAELQYEARYFFEQNALPSTIYANEKEVIKYISALDADGFEDIVYEIWARSVAVTILTEMEMSGEEAPETDELLWKLVGERALEYGLGEEHIVSLSIEKIDSDTTAVIIKMKDAKWILLSTYIGIAYNKSMGLKFFTLERSFDRSGGKDIPYMFCHIDADSRGSYYLTDNNKQSFINAVKSIMVVPSGSDKDTSVLIDGIKCSVEVKIVNFDPIDSGETMVSVSAYNEKGENVTSKIKLGKITLTKGSEKVSGNLELKGNEYSYSFITSWKPGDNISVSLVATEKSGTTVELTSVVRIKSLAEGLQDLFGPDVLIIVN